jgi:GDP-L-fucose synthase
VRDLIHVDDMVEAMVLAAEKLESYATLNIGLGKGYSVKEVLDLVLELDGFTDARVVYNKKMPTMIPLRLVDISKAETMIGYKPKVGLREGLKRTIEWYRASVGKAAG